MSPKLISETPPCSSQKSGHVLCNKRGEQAEAEVVPSSSLVEVKVEVGVEVEVEVDFEVGDEFDVGVEVVVGFLDAI